MIENERVESGLKVRKGSLTTFNTFNSVENQGVTRKI